MMRDKGSRVSVTDGFFFMNICFLLGKWSVQPLIDSQRCFACQSQKPGLVQQSLCIVGSLAHCIARRMAVNVVPPHFGMWMKWMLGQEISPTDDDVSVAFVAAVGGGGGGITAKATSIGTGGGGSNIIDCSKGG
jgi:hypothetical protein